MTTIIAKKNKNGSIDMGADSQVSSGTTVEKVFSQNDQMWVGVAGRALLGDAVRYADVPAVHPAELTAEGFDARGYLVTTAVPAWQKSIKTIVERSLDKDDEPWGQILVVLAGRIFSVGVDWAVSEFQEHGGIGSGANFARGALEAGKNVLTALEIAAKLDNGTGQELRVVENIK